MDELRLDVVIGKGGVVVHGAWLSGLECEALESALQAEKKARAV
jgi:hypothetical protein